MLMSKIKEADWVVEIKYSSECKIPRKMEFFYNRKEARSRVKCLKLAFKRYPDMEASVKMYSISSQLRVNYNTKVIVYVEKR